MRVRWTYSQRPKSEHIRISVNALSFGSNIARTTEIDQNPNVSFERSDFGQLMCTLYYKTPKSEHSNDLKRTERSKSEGLLTEQSIVWISALSEIRTFGFWTLTVRYKVPKRFISYHLRLKINFCY